MKLCCGYNYQIAFDTWLFCFDDLRKASFVVSIGHIIVDVTLLVLFYLKEIDHDFPPFDAAVAVNLVVYSWLTIVLVRFNSLGAIKVWLIWQLIYILACTAGINYVCIYSLYEFRIGRSGLKNIALLFLAFITTVCTVIEVHVYLVVYSHYNKMREAQHNNNSDNNVQQSTIV